VSENNVLLWGVYVDDERGGYWLGEDTPHCGAVLVWDSDTVNYAHEVAQGEGGKVMPYLTLKQVMDEFVKAKEAALKGSTPMQRRLLNQLFKSVGL